MIGMYANINERKKTKYLFEEVINEIKEMYLKDGNSAFYQDDGWCLYAKDIKIKLDSECYVLPYPEIDDEDDTEQFPEFAVQNNLEFVYRDELLQDVIAAAVDEDEDISNKKILKAIKYYDEYDTFMEFD